jgi:hypothetical protein
MKDGRKHRNDGKKHRNDEEGVSSYWIILWKREDNINERGNTLSVYR